MKRGTLLLLAVLLGAMPVSAQQPFTVGAWLDGELSEGDTRLVDGELYDEYVFDAQAAQVYRLELEAEGFAPTIIVTGPDGYPLLEMTGSAGRTTGQFATQEAGPYRIGIGGAGAEARGPYRLRLRRIGAASADTRGVQPPPPPPPSPPPANAIELRDTLPKASLKSALRLECLQGALTFGAIWDRLKEAVSDYGEPGLFLTATGFGIATRFERIDDDGRTIADQRWDTAPFYNGVWQVILHQTRPGRYRAYTIVYGTGIDDSAGPLTLGGVSEWVESASGRELPAAIRARRGGPDHYLQIFVYEYERPSISAPARLVRPTPRHEGHLGSPAMARVRGICGG